MKLLSLNSDNDVQERFASLGYRVRRTIVQAGPYKGASSSHIDTPEGDYERDVLKNALAADSGNEQQTLEVE